MADDPNAVDQTNSLLNKLVDLTGKNADTLAKLLSVARYGPTAGVGGVSGQPAGRRPPTPEELRLQAFNTRQTQLRERGMAYQQVGFGLGAYGQGLHQAANVAEGLHGLGAPKMASIAQRAAPVVAAVSMVGEAMDKIGKIAVIAHDNFSSAEEKGRALFRMLPGGETAQRFYDSISGRSDAMARIDQWHQQSQADIAGRGQISSFLNTYNPMQAGRAALASAFGRHYGGGMGPAAGTFHPVVDRSTAAGEIAYQNTMKMLPARKELLRTERELERATSERSAAEERVRRITKTQNDLVRERDELGRRIGIRLGAGGVYELGPGDGRAGPDRRIQLRRFEQISNELRMFGDQRIAAEQGVAGAKANEAGARGAFDRAQAGMSRARADVLQGAADRSRSTARTLGEMDPIQRQQGMNVLQMLKNGANPDLIPPELKALARSVAPQEYENIITKHGAKTSTFQQGQAQGLVGFEGDPFKLQKQADEERRKADESEFKADQKAAEGVAAAGADLGKVIAEQIRQMMDAAKREILNQMLLGRNTSS